MGEIYSALLYRSRQKSSGTQPYLNAKLVRPASRISLSRSNTQLKPYLKEKTIIPFCRYRRIHSHLCTKITEMIFHTKRAPQCRRQKCMIKISTQSFQTLNDTPVSPEHNTVEISLENKVLAEWPTSLHLIRVKYQLADTI